MHGTYGSDFGFSLYADYEKSGKTFLILRLTSKSRIRFMAQLSAYQQLASLQ